MIEIEVKVPIRERAKVISNIEGLGATLVEERDQDDLYLSHPSRDFGVTDEALRLRKDGPREVITYKGPKLDPRSKSREEIEFAVPFDQMRTVLNRLGFKESFHVRKRRKEYAIDDVRICLDMVEGLGDFVELEYEGQDLEAGLRKIEGLKEKLGIEGNETRSYLELLYFKK